MLYFTDSESLIKMHREGNFRDVHVVSYLLAFYVQSSFFNGIGKIGNSQKSNSLEFSWWMIVVVLAVVCICLIIVKWILMQWLQANGGQASKNFLNRIVSLVWVYGFKVMLVLAPLVASLYLVPDALKSIPFLITIVVSLLVVSIGGCVYVYKNVKRGLERISAGTPST